MTDQDLTDFIPDLMRLSLRLKRGDRAAAEDLAQEALLRVWARLRAEGRIDDLRPYLMEAARNLSRRPPHPTLPGDDLPEPSPPPEA